MLYLGNGSRQVTISDTESLYVFPDFSDKMQFYALPNFPHVAKMPDGSPAIRLLVYREDLSEIEEGDDEVVGFLSLDVEVGWSAEKIEEAAKKIRQEDELDEKPKITPIFYREGTVKLMLLDAVTPEEDEDPAKPTDFVTQIMGTASPSLYGDNRAIFQARLSKKGVVALSGALDGVTPIGVVYSLTFAGLQPAFNVKASVRWDKVYDHFSENEQMDFLFYESDIQKSIDKLIEDRQITFETTIEGIGAEAMEADRQEVEKSVRQLIFEQFFEATLKRETAAGDEVVGEVTDALSEVVKDSITLGIGYSYKRKEVRVEELRTLDLDWTARRAAERTIYPQAHMHSIVGEGGLTEDQLITVVGGGEDELWKHQAIMVTSTAAWEPDGIKGISVDLKYKDADSGQEHEWGTFLDKENPVATLTDWMDRTSGNDFKYKYEVIFLDEGVNGPSSKVTSGDEYIDYEGANLVINPRDLYESIELETGVVPGFDFVRWPAVQAVIRYRTITALAESEEENEEEQEEFVHYEDGVLTSAMPNFKTRFRVDKDVPGIREIRTTYIGNSGEIVETDWIPMPQDQWVVVDPHNNKLTIRAIVAGDRKNIANLMVDLMYVDEEAGIHETGFIQFDADNINKPQGWTVHLADPKKRHYKYRMTLITKDTGDFIQTDWITTDAPMLPIGEVYVRTLNVDVKTGAFADNIESVKVKLEYHDEVNALHKVNEFTLRQNSHANWQLKLKDATQRGYQLTTTWVSSDGFDTTIGPENKSGSSITIEGSPPE